MGGQVAGELLNPKESPRKQFVIQTAGGAKVTLDAKLVKRMRHQREELAEYERIRPTYADTIEAQWKLAEWCREHRLTAQRQDHLRRIIELNPDHADARRALGYSQIDGKWATRDEVMTGRGYVRHKGKWRLPQEIELLEKKEELHDAQKEWFIRLKRWRGWLDDSDRASQAVTNIRSIDDPAATKALVLGLRDESDPKVRKLYISVLAGLDSPEAPKALAIAAIVDPVEDVRLTSLDYLEKKIRPEVTAYFVGKLRSKDNVEVNLAGIALGRLKDPTSIGPLIDALATSHKFKIVSGGGGEGSINPSFNSRGGGGLSVGKKPKYIRRLIPNQAVLDALVKITGCNFNFDEKAWKYWYAAQKKPAPKVDARRD